ncbi:MAG TPA: sulfate adenylyltransferase subunit CysN [Cellvibrionaceae bacterium]|nr:sulfate adenylyltransferase subunit CysN [Cellvibrionaceae bacterium]
MSHQSDLIATDINAYLAQHEQKELLRFLTCGSVDDGKSTLIGRLLHDSKMIYEDQLEAIKSDSLKHGTTGEKIDLALLVDGLQAEREQGITIDVAYRYFSTAKRKFIIADTPGHEQYTRNMATGASTCDLAVILIDARYGVVTQTRRHSFIASLLGIKHVVVAINKMDLVGFSQEVFDKIKADYQAFSKSLNQQDYYFVPMSALDGDNVVNRSERAAWYQGPTLMEVLETVPIAQDKNLTDFRFPVQLVNRPHLDFRGFCGTIASGLVKPGDALKVLPSGKTSRVKQLINFEGPMPQAFAGQAITITLDDEIDISRGDMLVKADDSVSYTNQLTAHLVWMAESPLQPGKEYLFKFATKVTLGSVERIHHRVDVNELQFQPAERMQLNDIAKVDVGLQQPVVVDNYQRNRGTGAFIVIDRLTNVTVGAGMVEEARAFSATAAPSSFSEFELELNSLIRKHFPHWEAKDLSQFKK